MTDHRVTGSALRAWVDKPPEPTYRVTGSSLRVWVSEAEEVSHQVTGSSLRAWVKDVRPLRPTLDVLLLTFDSVTLQRGPFEGVADGETLAGHEWEIAAAADTEFASPLIERSTDAEDSDGQAFDPLTEETAYRARVRAIGTIGGASEWSAVVEFTTPPSVIRPDTPTVSEIGVGEDFLEVAGDEFTHPDGAVPPEDFDPEDPKPYHAIIQWQVRVQGESWDDAIFDPGPEPFDSDLTLLLGSLDPDATHEVRVRYGDGVSGVLSLWSAPLTVTTDEIPPIRPEKPTILSVSCGDPTEVTASAFVGGDGGSTVHIASQWDMCEVLRDESGAFVDEVGDCVTFPSAGPSELTAFTFPEIDDHSPRRWIYRVRYQDGDGAWSEWSDHVFNDPTLRCQTLTRPFNPEILSPVGGQPFDGSITVEIKQRRSALTQVFLISEPEWEHAIEIASGNGTVWETLVDDLPRGPLTDGYWYAQEYEIPITGRPNGLYIIRVQTRHPEGGPVSDWSHVAVWIDRAGTVAFKDFAQLPDNQIPETMVRRWSDTEATEWRVARNATGYPSAGPGDEAIGILGRHNQNVGNDDAVLAFSDLGEPLQGTFVVQYQLAVNDWTFYGYRFRQHPLQGGGIALFASGETGGDPMLGFGIMNRGGEAPSWSDYPVMFANCVDRSFPSPDPLCPCQSLSCGQCQEGGKGKAGAYRNRPNRLHRYAMAPSSSHNVAVGLAVQTVPNIVATGRRSILPPEGPKTRGLQLARRAPAGIGCSIQYEWVTMVVDVREAGGGIQVRSKVFGPGIDPTAREWDWSPTFSNLLEAVGCGACGLFMRHTPFYSGTLGVLFRSFAAQIDDALILNGPSYGTPTVEVTS